MANSICFSPLISAKPIENKPGLISRNYTSSRNSNLSVDIVGSSRSAAFEALKVKATSDKPATKVHSILCGECEGEGCKKCTQCTGTGVNSVDHFNGQFKAGSMCWLCRGKKQILCGNCNGAGFLGGFMSTQDE